MLECELIQMKLRDVGMTFQRQYVLAPSQQNAKSLLGNRGLE